MDVRDPAVDQLADQDLGALTHSFGHMEDVVTLRMAPPATPDLLAGDSLREARDAPSRSLEHDSVTLHESQSLFRGHSIPVPLTGHLSAERQGSAAPT